MKIGIVTSSLSKTNGWGRYSFEIVKELKNYGEVKVITYKEAEGKEGVESCSILPAPSSCPLKMMQYLPKLVKHLKGCDIIHCLVEPYAPVVALANILLRKPFFITTHGTYAIMPLDKGGTRSLLMKFVYGRTKKVLSVSTFTKKEILRRCNLDNIEVIPNGVDYDSFQKYKPNERPKKEITILSVGPIKLRKGYDISINAISRLKRGNIRYYIAGDVQSISFFEELQETIKRENLEDKIVVLGRVSDDELLDLYSTCDIFLLTPKNIDNNVEGFGLVYLEANACGKPVIGTYGCGAEDAIINGYNGLLVPQNDPGKTAEAIEYLLDNPKVARKMGENGRKRAKELSWKNIVKRIIQVYEESLGKNRQ